MKGIRKKTSKAGQSLTTAILVGVAGAILLSVLVTALLTNLILNGTVPEKSADNLLFLIRGISVFTGALVGGTVFRQRYLLQVGITTLVYWLVLVGVGVIICKEGLTHFLTGTVSVLIGGVGALLVLQRPRRKSHRPHKYNL